ncbi:MAG: bifunctional metallophosphatase/5'-nucleotidase, partial [Oscillospiraceae bacterium]|nr:bifunctional metallophosphatase/5'-nucleotidase [Oscillospiraceae bacterium]
MKASKKLLSLLLSLVMVIAMAVPAMAADAPKPTEGTESGDIVVLYTNDVHTYLDKDLTYSLVSAYRDTLDNVLLVDAGDHIQGTAFGGMDSGATIIKLMNAAGYDLATLGNHEFDYGMQGCMNAIDWAEFPYVSCNFYHEKDGVVGDRVLDSYKVFEVAGPKIAFFGLSTPAASPPD